MKTLKKTITFLLILFIMVSFYNCSSAKMLQNEPLFEIGEAYYQASNSDIHVYISIKSNPNNILLDSVYFKGKQAKLEHENNLFVGRFKSSIIQKQDIIMSNEPYAEYGNKTPKLPEKLPFELKESECVVSYIDDNSIKYFKIKNVVQKELLTSPDSQ
ncbi:hypothetical protein [Confluentibacter citreus]|uniref:hypothetical protein n=1 Tax=Confluentibacter citreus TaxID=2007307 RepID=UPI000C2824C8|nr:hypothetical protein [Confluentibacter citreus]